MPDNVRNLLHQGDNSILLSLILLIVVVLLVIICIYTMWRLSVIKRRLTAMTRGMENVNLEQVLVSSLDKVDNVQRRIESVEQAVAVLQAQVPGCIQRVNMLRYDAFEDVGGQQSFTIAMLDGIGDGIVLTSVFSRLEIRVYAKSIRNGRASHALSEEEARVLKDAVAR